MTLKTSKTAEKLVVLFYNQLYAYVLLFAKVKVQNPPLCCPKRIVTTRQEEWNCFWKERAITQACKVRLVDTWHRTRLQKRVGKLWSVRLKGSLGIVILAFFCCLVLHSCGEFIDQCGVEELCFLKGSKQKIGLVLINHLCIMWRLTITQGEMSKKNCEIQIVRTQIWGSPKTKEITK